MLGSLIKHEFRATSRIMLPLYLVVAVVSVCGNVSTRVMESSDSRLLNLVGGLVIFAFAVGLIAIALMSLYLMISRFHKNLLTDEGYLMFTLPASVHSLIFSKLLVSVDWFAITALVVGLAFLLLAFRVDYLDIYLDIFGQFGELMADIGAYHALNGVVIAVEMLVLALIGSASFCLVVYAAAALGHSFANHKILLSFVFFFLFSWAGQYIGIGGFLALDGLEFNFLLMEHLSAMGQIHAAVALFFLSELVYCAIFYVITAISLQKHINLE